MGGLSIPHGNLITLTTLKLSTSSGPHFHCVSSTITNKTYTTNEKRLSELLKVF